MSEAAQTSVSPPPDDPTPWGAPEHVEAVIGPLFDAGLYAAEYPDVAGGADGLLRHYCLRGWREGRNPNRGFDTTAYLLAHADVVAAGMNPFYHYLIAGRAEGRAVAAATLPSDSVARAHGRPPLDWVALLRDEVDLPFYTGGLGAEFDGRFDPVAHYCFRGWLEGRDPNPHFSVRAALAANPRLLTLRLNPSVDARLAAKDRADPPPLQTTRFPLHALIGVPLPAPAPPAPASAASYDDPVEQCVAASLDRAYYLAAHADVRAHGADPVSHYCQTGWIEDRNPAPWFDTAYYKAANPDVVASQLNPFWHYLIAGKAEGRQPKQPGGYRRQIVDAAVPPDEITGHYHRPEVTGVLSRAALEGLLRPALQAANGLAISVGHDRYISVTGGIQLFLGQEQARFAAQGVAYLNLSPFTSLLRLADPGQAGLMLNLVLDGSLAGVATAPDLAAVLGDLPRPPGERRLFLVHCLLGHSISDLTGVHRAAGCDENYFWLHDYSSLCAGYNLLRNDVAFCDAPPPESMACRVCVYGLGRAQHSASVAALFEAVPFHVVAPSAAALRLWQGHARFPHLSATVHAHGELVPAVRPAPGSRLAGDPVRVAYVGHNRANKGWPVFLEITARCAMHPAYRFFHLGSADTDRSVAGVEHHTVVTSREQPDAMIVALAALEIDLVLMPSPWPETFSYVTYEALAAGADVACLASSGNVADLVLSRQRGVVAADEASLVDFFESHAAIRYAALARAHGTPRAELRLGGTTATMPRPPAALTGGSSR